MITVQLVNLPEVIKWWDLSLPLLHKALKNRKAEHKYPISWLREECISGNAQLWLIWKDNKITAAAMTRIQFYPSMEKFLEVFALGGWKMPLWAAETYTAVEDFAHTNNCKAIVSHGRGGWLKLAEHMAGKDNVQLDHVVAITI